VEFHLMNSVIEFARSLEYRRVVGEYIPTAKNLQVASFYPSAGFKPVGPTDSNLQTFELDMASFVPCTNFVRSVS
jgi:predicted enzyme involved in methoxymalonyl-ACP biosynthesis